ncbi:uncharacterized protein C8Q71DRAFT_219137 [Rhodofomes roseus]|uniref:Uncharacterized protein n=1 Tax=Rhodofomes roseus TaxID=34475 RepID=A0A4Y9YRS1_9APHY|nr:uncharacterized protein C8Q71DRAFT_219137 [Rhodofomes roseus]KAH9842758.1 hypothetical protein C8Q71DRAFT_219137 [Rhodofomes roseus]TFY64862.1 hypothetical protein EVJ58_g2342 [Rhodofomes roseus]
MSSDYSDWQALEYKIKRPRQIAQCAAHSQNGHNTLRNQMNLSEEEFDDFVKLIDKSVERHLVVSLPWTKQPTNAKKEHIDDVASHWVMMYQYDGPWPIEAYTTKFAKLSSHRPKLASHRPKSESRPAKPAPRPTGGKKSIQRERVKRAPKQQAAKKRVYREQAVLDPQPAAARPKPRCRLYVGVLRGPSRQATSTRASSTLQLPSIAPQRDVEEQPRPQAPPQVQAQRQPEPLIVRYDPPPRPSGGSDAAVRDFLLSLPMPMHMLEAMPRLVQIGIRNEEALRKLATAPLRIKQRALDALGLDNLSTEVLNRGLLNLASQM